jgi:thioredoxin
MIHMNQELFQQALQGEKPVLVEFWAPWCVYCRRIEAATAKVAEQFGHELVIGQVNIDEEALLSHQEQIEVIPTFVLYRDGKAISSVVAPESKAALENFIREGL